MVSITLFILCPELTSIAYLFKVKFNSRRKIDVFVNGERVEFDEQSRLDFTGVFVVQQNQSEITIYFTSGISVAIKAIEDFLTYQISIPTRFKGLYLIIILIK